MIVFAHLLNDRSGSPKVLAEAIEGLSSAGQPTALFVGSDGSGCLDDVGVPTTRYWYRRGAHRLTTLFAYVASQLALFGKLLLSRGIPKDAIVYANTLLPFGAAVYGRLTGRKVVYHLHEVSLTPWPLQWFLTTVARWTAAHLIYVSEFHRHCLPIPGVPATTVFNALDPAFVKKGKQAHYRHRRDGAFRVLMLASLRDYKGIPEFIELARRVSEREDINFDLIANDDEEAVVRYFASRKVPGNVTVHARTSDLTPWYAKASLVINLSRPDQWIETFGLTLLEAMVFGVPVIAPPVGGPCELISDGREGFLLDCRRMDELVTRVLGLADDEPLSRRLSEAARHRALNFSRAAFVAGLREALELDTPHRKQS
ncbi:glycosyltransferase family 4 protein [Ramlibacter ginsenosidimutans]|uniref:Glycosyltransferase family 4 protein n=1 Tax=Ramlibacter ginsenosidimutans TaxID=502333 RepID=A0A934TSE1_9BURK|nr:glycosyltransferase family 4 protein [Ramlibacter ginsenosidimutans]MBK6006674.1 glycosyltransferase family 4 protein [Ramlibacter ginsenosidimutans]